MLEPAHRDPALLNCTRANRLVARWPTALGEHYRPGPNCYDVLMPQLRFICSLLLVACGGAAGSTDAALDASPQDSSVDDAPRSADATPDSPPTVECGERSAEGFFVLSHFEIGREDPPGAAPGFDLDGLVSDGESVSGCMQPDYLSPDGTPGIDNQFSILVNSDTTIGPRLEAGEFLLLVEVSTGADSFQHVDLYQGLVPEGGALERDDDGRVSAGQTFDVDSESVDPAGDAWLSLGWCGGSGGPVNLVVPLEQGVRFEITLRDSVMAFDVVDDALVRGVLGGSIDIEEMVAVVVLAGGDALPVDLVRSTLLSVADLEPDSEGACQSLSAAFEFSGVAAVRGAVTRASER